MRWLRENKGVAGPERSRCEQVRITAKNGQARWKKLDQLDKKIREKSAEEAPVRLFLLLTELFSKFESEPMNFEEYKDTMLDDTVTYFLRQTLENYGKLSYYELGVEKLKETFSTWQTFWHLHWLKEDVGLGASFSVLEGKLHFKLREFLDKFVERCIQLDVIELDGKHYCHSNIFSGFPGRTSQIYRTTVSHRVVLSLCD